MVVLSKIYTRTGDAGTTRLSDNSVTSKLDPRIEAYGTVDETNSTIGMALSTRQVPEQVAKKLRIIQNELFDVGADLSTPLAEEYEYPPLRVDPASIERLEQWCDELSEELPTLRSFILPGGNPAGAWLHMARTICRRAERAAWVPVAAFREANPDADPEAEGGVNLDAVKYLNRLSDFLFLASRAVNGVEDEVLWVPGTDRAKPDDAE